MTLTDKQQRFVTEYLVDQNATQAAIRAGYAKSGARTEGARLLANADIAALVKRKQAKVAEKAEWTAADRLASLKSIHDASLEDDRRTAIVAIAEANKMSGSYPPAQHRLAGPNGGPIQTVDLTKLSGDELAQLEAIFGPLAGAAGDDAEDDPAGEGEESR